MVVLVRARWPASTRIVSSRAQARACSVTEVPSASDPRVKKDDNAIKKVYLVTIPHPGGALPKRLATKSPPRPQAASPITYPGKFSRQDIEKIFLDSAAHPLCEGGGSYDGSIDLLQMAIFMELHKPVLCLVSCQTLLCRQSAHGGRVADSPTPLLATRRND